ncbi:pyrazinamidase nicotinamidase [Phlyctema vagabunda]|uniref:nicotinamidase n=1 Tax=Phlyctema vagabunda TaxID=108571 RepID=A0ABR4PFX5_9HELO
METKSLKLPSSHFVPSGTCDMPQQPGFKLLKISDTFHLNLSPCHGNGALAVPEGRAILPTLEHLLGLPFILKIATQDWHPPGHISFASSHTSATATTLDGAHCEPAPYTTYTIITNPSNATETYQTRLWPDHCIQETWGARLLPPLLAHHHHIDHVIQKGGLARVEMYSAFYAPLQQPRVGDSGLAALLRARAVSHVFVVGLAADYCVRATAEDAVHEGWTAGRTLIVDEGTRAVDQDEWETKGRVEVEGAGVRVVKVDGHEVRRVRELASKIPCTSAQE